MLENRGKFESRMASHDEDHERMEMKDRTRSLGASPRTRGCPRAEQTAAAAAVAARGPRCPAAAAVARAAPPPESPTDAGRRFARERASRTESEGRIS
uniref:Uncharacterized protein n=1 Tax=Pristionchus pacificus TaxID=54126 RepID=A0A2A6C9L9_PRIPA|eukprot:PDM74753.1 hypothetical protein PRIPAC_43704 [Pristionchus pacificus]